MDLEIEVYVMPRLPSPCGGSYVATLREVTNGIIENQYLRLVLTLVYLSRLPPCPYHPLAAQGVRSSRAIYDACSKSFALYANDYGCAGEVYRPAVIAIKLAEDSFSRCGMRSEFLRSP